MTAFGRSLLAGDSGRKNHLQAGSYSQPVKLISKINWNDHPPPARGDLDRVYSHFEPALDASRYRRRARGR